MKKILVFVCIIAGFLLLIPPCVSAIRYDVVQSSFENQIENTDVTVYIHGGIGIAIYVYGVSDETAVGVVTKGFIMPIIDSSSHKDYVYVYLSTMAPIPTNFKLYVTVYGQTFSYKGHAFFLFDWGITPIDT